MKLNRSNPFVHKLRGAYVVSVAAIHCLGSQNASAQFYWDVDGDTPGAGGATPTGNWEDANWSSSPDGDAVTENWFDGLDVAVFSAGTDATGDYTVTVADPHIIGGVTVEEGNPTISGAGELELTSLTVPFDVASSATISTTITGIETGIVKSGVGTLTLSGPGTFDGDIRINRGTLTLSSTLPNLKKLSFGSNGPFGSTQDLNIVPGAEVTTERLVMADLYYTENILTQSGGTLNITGTNDTNSTMASFLMGHWGYGSTCVYGLSGGTLNSLGARLSLGWDRQNTTFNQTGGTANLLGINLSNGRNNPAAFNLTAGRLNLGAGGINNATNKSVNIGEATLGAFANWTSTKPLTLTGGTLNVDTADSVDGTTGRTIALSAGVSETAPAGITVTGSGTLALGGATYTGDTVVDGGRLIPGPVLNSKIIVNAGGALGGGTATTPGVSTVGNVELDGGSITPRVGFFFDQVDALDVNIVSASTVGALPSEALFVDDEFPVLKYATLSGLGFAGLSAAPLPNPHYSTILVDDSANNQVVLKVTGADSLIWTGSVDNSWDNDATANWELSSNGDPSKFYAFDAITFDDSSAVGNIVLSGTIEPADIIVENNVTDYAFSGSPIGGSTGIYKTGGASLDLSGSNTFSGLVDIASGRVITSTATSLGTGSTPVTLGFDAILQNTASYTLSRGLELTGGSAILDTDDGTTLTMTQAFTGSSLLDKTGTGTLRIQGYGGGSFTAGSAIEVSEGTLVMGGAAFNSNIGLSAITVQTGATLLIPVGSPHALGGAFTTSPVVNLEEASTFTLEREQYLDTLNITGATIDGVHEIRTDYTFNANILPSAMTTTWSARLNSVNSPMTFNVSDGAADPDLSMSGQMLGPQPFVKTGDGTMELTSINDYTGNTTVAGGILKITAATPFDSSPSVEVGTGAVLDSTGIGSPLVIPLPQTLKGEGTVVGDVQLLGSVAPGASSGALTVDGALELPGSSEYVWEVTDWDAGAVAGTGYDTLLADSVAITATSGNPCYITIEPSSVVGFAEENRTFPILQTTGGITGFSADAFDIDASALTAETGSFGTWSIELQGNNLVLVYTASLVSPFQAWVTGPPYNLAGADATETADPDNDGIANSIEFVIGGNPASESNSDLLPDGEPVSVDLGAGVLDYYKFTYRRTADSAYLNPGVEHDTDLVAPWTFAENGVDGVVVQESPGFYGAGIDRVECYIPLPLGGRLFGRLVVPDAP